MLTSLGRYVGLPLSANTQQVMYFCSKVTGCLGAESSNELCNAAVQHLARLLCGNVTNKGLTTLDGTDWCKINTNDEAAHRHVLDSHLKPPSCKKKKQCFSCCAPYMLLREEDSANNVLQTAKMSRKVRDHLPGAAHRSSKVLLLSRKLYFRLSWMSLNAARDRYLSAASRLETQPLS